MNATLRNFFNNFIVWINNQEHGKDCRFGYVVQSGPAEGNKINCTCGLHDLQRSAYRIIGG